MTEIDEMPNAKSGIRLMFYNRFLFDKKLKSCIKDGRTFISNSIQVTGSA